MDQGQQRTSLGKPHAFALGEPGLPGLGLLLAGTDEANLICMGSGFVCSPRLVLTARHVIDEIFRHFTGALPQDARGALTFGIQFASFGRGGEKRSHDVERFALSSSIDVAALVVSPEDTGAPANWESLPLSADFPVVGEVVTAYGFPETTIRQTADGAKVRISPTRMPGTVHEVHHAKRDGTLLSFPCFRTDATHLGGASGGPVLNEKGEVCGVVCTGFETDDPEESLSYASAVWPALGLELDVELHSGAFSTVEPYPIKDLASSGLLAVTGLSRVRVVREHGNWHAKWA